MKVLPAYLKGEKEHFFVFELAKGKILLRSSSALYYCAEPWLHISILKIQDFNFFHLFYCYFAVE